MQVWFQAVHLDVWSNPIATVSNMVPVSIQSDPIPGMVYINGSTFEMGDHFNVGSGSERPVHSVTLNSFFLDEHEVSNLQFANYLNAELAASNVLVSGGGVYQVSVLGHQICELADGLSYSNGQIVVAAGKEQHPVVRVTWYGAALYCNYSSAENLRQPCYDPLSFACDYSVDGFRLPTEAEYEFASRGGEHSPYFLYSWGSDSVTSGDANYGNTINSTVTRGSYAANNYGLFDISGNAAEWCNDWYMSGYYDVSELINPVGPIFGTNRVARGGGWNASASDLRSAKRDFYNPMVLHPYVGFRVATQG
ncbi:MAG: SUMF1/EgtB/PvdO family nonheme iron enzyme [Planctomycetes bacterium]|nr:SUMF1/EgtB/PvdO family nonheme iron enzyme [Planctomycetota bacterium]